MRRWIVHELGVRDGVLTHRRFTRWGALRAARRMTAAGWKALTIKREQP